MRVTPTQMGMKKALRETPTIHEVGLGTAMRECGDWRSLILPTTTCMVDL